MNEHPVHSFPFHIWCMLFWNGNAKINNRKTKVYVALIRTFDTMLAALSPKISCAERYVECTNATIQYNTISNTKAFSKGKELQSKMHSAFEFFSKEMREEWQQTTFISLPCSVWHLQ